MMGRAAAWAVAAIPAGIGQGIALREKQSRLERLAGERAGGLLGGLAFDPIAGLYFGRRQAWLSRAVGFTLIGLMVGLFVGIVEQWTKTAWLLMKAGPLAGKQFVVFRNPTVLGSAPKADVYLFKDEAIEPRHALIHDRGGRFEIEDMDTADGTYVNGIPVREADPQIGRSDRHGQDGAGVYTQRDRNNGSSEVIRRRRRWRSVSVSILRQKAQSTRKRRRHVVDCPGCGARVTCPEPVYDAGGHRHRICSAGHACRTGTCRRRSDVRVRCAAR